MNYTNIKQYFDLLLKRERTSDQMYEAIGEKLDKIWYDFGEDEVNEANRLLQETKGEQKECRYYKILSTIEEKIMNEKTHKSVFETREDYQKLRTFWKQFHAEGKHKAVPVEYRTSKPFNSGYGDGELAYHKVSPLTMYHHMVYLAAMGKPLACAFRNVSYHTHLDAIWYVSKGNSYGIYNKQNNPFALFGDAIDPKYHDAIIERITKYVTE